MKVLKFGGTSVGSINSILNLKDIVEKAALEQPIIVVVSALGGITDKLISTAHLALRGDETYKSEVASMEKRHHDMAKAIISDKAVLNDVEAIINEHFEQLKSLYHGVSLIHDLSSKTYDTIVSYGERISSRIVAALIDKAVWKDSRSIIMTEQKGGKHYLDSQLTYNLIQQEFASGIPQITVMGGFISSDKNNGETTNLGRGGSDYTAALIAAALDAESLEIWTDVDGFMTADPRMIPSAYVIPELSYVEATELCNFGAKVVYPPTIYPVCVKGIPIWIKNTFNPSAPGTVIKGEIENDGKPIKGISSINDTSLITVSGLSMVGVIGVNRRIFTALAAEGISVFMVSQASSENSTSIGVKDSDADRAAKALNEEFEKEILTGAIYPMNVQHDLVTIAIVGENMRHQPGVAGKLFGAMGRSGINVIICSQGASETNISFVVEKKWLQKALSVLHDSFFLSEHAVLNVYVCGVGTVGSKLIEQMAMQNEVLKHERKLRINVVGISNSRHALFDPEGLNLDCWRQALDESPKMSTEATIDHILSLNLYNSVFVDCTANQHVASSYLSLLKHNISVVAANKIAASGPYEIYDELKRTALSKGVKFRFETNVGAGLPIINTINDLCASGDKILKIEAVLSGTLNYIFDTLSSSISFSQAVRNAVDEGYSEPDPRIDLSGADVARKIVILAREAGYKVEIDNVEKTPLLPQEMFDGSVEDFWDSLTSMNDSFESARMEAEKEGKKWRYVAIMDHGKLSIGLRKVDSDHPFYRLEGSNNIVVITTERYRQYPMLIKGYGAGASVTAAGVFANLLSIANV